MSKYSQELNAKVETALGLIRDNAEKFGDKIYAGTSGGKDSAALRHLTESLGLKIEWVHNAKPYPFTHPYTVELLYSAAIDGQDLNFVHRDHMGDFIKQRGYQAQLDGSRRAEFDRTDGKCTTVMLDGEDINREQMPPVLENSLFGLTFVYPMYDWSDQDVFDYLEANNVYLSPEYVEEHKLIKRF